MSKQLNKKEEDRNIIIKVNPKIMVPLVGFFLCAAIGAWFGWSLATPTVLFPRWPIWEIFSTATIVVCALIAGLVGCVVCWCCTKDDDGRTPLHNAARWSHKGHKKVAELLISKGADVNAKDDIGMTPLHDAALFGRKEIVELLIAEGADVNVKVVSGGHKGKTPLDAANETNHPETADLLHKHGGKTSEELKAAGK